MRIRPAILFLILADVAIVALGLRSITTAHPAQPVAQSGTLVWAEQTTHRSSDYWQLGIGSPKNRYHLETRDYSPDLPDFDLLLAQPVTIWTDAGSRDVLAVSIADQRHLTLFGRHPAMEEVWGLERGVVLLEVGVVTFGIFLLFARVGARSRKAGRQVAGGSWSDSASHDAMAAVLSVASLASVAAVVVDLFFGAGADDGVALTMWILGYLATGGTVPVLAAAGAFFVWPGNRARTAVGVLVGIISAAAGYVAPFIVLVSRDLSGA